MMKSESGFTIVELLIVIVVIAVLAAITLVSYNGITQRANLSVAQSDLKALNEVIELYHIDNGNYPNSRAEWNQILKSTSLFDATRDPDKKSFIVCSKDGTYAIFVYAPLNPQESAGATWYYVTNQGGQQTLSWDTSVSGPFRADRACAQSPANPAYFADWSWNI